MPTANHVRIVEVGARDGLQNEKTLLPAEVKIALIDRLSSDRPQDHRSDQLRQPEVGAATGRRGRGVPRHPQGTGRQLSRCWCPTCRAMRVRVKSAPREIAIFTAASEAFNRKNINASIDESIERFIPVMEQALADGVPVRGYVSTVLGCPYQGEVPVRDVVRVAKRMFELGCHEISLGDTIGVGTPAKARAMLHAVAQEVPMAALAVHFHDTYGQALANILACLEEGVRVVDSAVSGTGGCPYAKGATGNVASEDVVYMLHGMGMDTGVDLDLLVATGAWLAGQLHKDTASRVTRARTAVT